MKLNIAELDCIFISYDEPNAEENWANLLDKCMWAKRVHGVKGSDACHKAAAKLSETDWFITVDADNIVNSNFFDQEIEVPPSALAFSWPGVHIINGLRYGNGSLKVWKKDFVLGMRSHEAADKDTFAVDFCWDNGYRLMVESFSITYPNATPFQAWRAGFREGVKMSLVNGIRDKEPNVDKIHWHNLHRLKIWMSVGAHIDNGVWAILGARHGCYKINCTDWNYTEVRDFDRLQEIWTEVEDLDVYEAIAYYGDQITSTFKLSVPLLDKTVSEYVVTTFQEQYQQAVEQIQWVTKRNNV